MGSYKLQCVAGGELYDDTSYMLSCPAKHGSLLRAVYGETAFKVREDQPGLFRYMDWLPVGSVLDVPSCPVTYRSEGLAGELGLDELYISFNGYWPEKGAYMETCSFKELEAPPTIARFRELSAGTMVLASAGNTARSFGWLCSRTGTGICLVVPDCAKKPLWYPEPLSECVRLISVRRGDYLDSIKLADALGREEGYNPEGGARNVARRDGMGAVLLNAVEAMGAIPDYYFQAIGSGTGAIAAWEANLRLIGDGRYGQKKASLQLAQNSPFTPMVDAWRRGSRELCDLGGSEARERVDQAISKVLTNREPPYCIGGGVYDALVDTAGDMHEATNREATDAAALFEKSEGIDILPAAGVAVSALASALEAGKISRDRSVLLNITGGGTELLNSERKLFIKTPDITVDWPDTDMSWLLQELEAL